MPLIISLELQLRFHGIILIDKKISGLYSCWDIYNIKDNIKPKNYIAMTLPLWFLLSFRITLWRDPWK